LAAYQRWRNLFAIASQSIEYSSTKLAF